jgi:hypothetical protein
LCVWKWDMLQICSIIFPWCGFNGIVMIIMGIEWKMGGDVFGYITRITNYIHFGVFAVGPPIHGMVFRGLWWKAFGIGDIGGYPPSDNLGVAVLCVCCFRFLYSCPQLWIL